MKDKDVKIGMKVVPHKKTRGFVGDNRTNSDLANSYIWNYAKGVGQSFLYVTRKESNYWVLSYDKSQGIMGDFFNASDFKPFHPSEKNVLQTQLERIQKELDNLKALLEEK